MWIWFEANQMSQDVVVRTDRPNFTVLAFAFCEPLLEEDAVLGLFWKQLTHVVRVHLYFTRSFGNQFRIVFASFDALGLTLHYTLMLTCNDVSDFDWSYPRLLRLHGQQCITHPERRILNFCLTLIYYFEKGKWHPQLSSILLLRNLSIKYSYPATLLLVVEPTDMST